MKISVILFLLITTIVAGGQVPAENPETLYREMKSLAEDGNTLEAKELGYRILAVQPGYTDVQVYLALIHGRVAEYDLGLSLLEPVLALYPDHADAHHAKCSLLFWSNRWKELLTAAGKALEFDQDNPDLLYKRAVAHYQLGEQGAALRDLDRIMDKDPGHEQARSLRSEIYIKSEDPELFARYLYDHFEQPYMRRWHMVTLGGNYPISRGTIVPSFSTGHFVDEASAFLNTSAFQLNTDAYIDITEKNYLLAGYGIGTGTYLPRHRAILHVWQVLPGGWGVSAGARYFYFDQHYIFYAVGGEKYLGNYWFELKNYIFSKDYGISVSSYFTVRRYLENKYNYLSATLGYGTSPDEPYTSVTELQRLNAISARVSMMRQLSGKIRVSAGAGYQYEEYREMVFRHRFSIQASIFYKIDRN